MAEAEKTEAGRVPEPRGFGEHTRGLAGEYAHEEGWGLDLEERTKLAEGPQDTSGGKDYNYGARDLGDEPVNMERVATHGAPNEEAVRQAFGLDPAGTSTGKGEES